MKPKNKSLSENPVNNYSDKEIQSLIECNKILKEHVEFLRVKLKNAETLLELYLSIMESEEKEEKEEKTLNKFNLLNLQ
jgi:hypothetical protein